MKLGLAFVVVMAVLLVAIKNGSDETTNEDNMGLTYAKSFYFPWLTKFDCLFVLGYHISVMENREFVRCITQGST